VPVYDDQRHTRGRSALVIDAAGNSGYQAGNDPVIEIVTPVMPIDSLGMLV
jgi:hypothetical protein